MGGLHHSTVRTPQLTDCTVPGAAPWSRTTQWTVGGGGEGINGCGCHLAADVVLRWKRRPVGGRPGVLHEEGAMTATPEFGSGSGLFRRKPVEEIEDDRGTHLSRTLG